MRMCRRLVHHQNATNSVNYSPPRIGQATFIPLPNNDPLSHKYINHKAFTNIHPKLNPCGPTRVPMTATSSGSDGNGPFVMPPGGSALCVRIIRPKVGWQYFDMTKNCTAWLAVSFGKWWAFFFIPIQKHMLPSGAVTRTARWPGPVDRIAVIKSGKRAVFRKC